MPNRSLPKKLIEWNTYGNQRISHFNPYCKSQI